MPESIEGELSIGLKSKEQGSTEICLDFDDVQWLAHLANIPEDTITDEWLSEANQLIRVGSLSPHAHPHMTERIKEARSKFYGQMLQWDEKNHPLRQMYLNRRRRKYLGPPNSVITTMRYLHDEGIDSLCLFRYGWLNPASSLQPAVETIVSLGFNPVEMARRAPALFNRKPSAIVQTHALLRGILGDEQLHKVLNGSPMVLAYGRDNIATTAYVARIYSRGLVGLRSQLPFNTESLLLTAVSQVAGRQDNEKLQFGKKTCIDQQRRTDIDKRQELRTLWVRMSEESVVFPALSRYFWSVDRSLRKQVKADLDPSGLEKSPFSTMQAWARYASEHAEELFPH